MGSHSRQRTIVYQWLLRELASPRDQYPDWLSNTKWSALKLYTNKMDSARCIHISVCKLREICTTIIKRGYQCEGCGLWQRLEGGQGRAKGTLNFSCLLFNSFFFFYSLTCPGGASGALCQALLLVFYIILSDGRHWLCWCVIVAAFREEGNRWTIYWLFLLYVSSIWLFQIL